MFRNPRENASRPPTSRAPPSTGRAPSPSPSPLHASHSLSASIPPPMAAKPAARKLENARTPAKARQTTLTPRSGAGGNKRGKGNGNGGLKQNGNIMAFFKRAEDLNTRLFVEERGGRGGDEDEDGDGEIGWEGGEEVEMEVEVKDEVDENEGSEHVERFNENGGSVKRRRVDGGCTPPPPDIAGGDEKPRHIGPFVQESDSEDEDPSMTRRIARRAIEKRASEGSRSDNESDAERSPIPMSKSVSKPPLLKTESTTYTAAGDFEEFQDFEDEDLPEGEEYDERRWMDEQRRLEEMAQDFEGEVELNDENGVFGQLDDEAENGHVAGDSNAPSCPICSASLVGFSDQDASVHVNGCLDGTSAPIIPQQGPELTDVVEKSKRFKRLDRPAKPGQANPFQLGGSTAGSKSAFSKLMSSHAEDAAWAAAAAADSAARGKPAYQRTCPFYKILPGMFICVDAFRYGAVKDCQAYFLSHFHSDHYIGLTSSWNHGPIYCSRVTGNLVRQQLRVDPKWVVDLEFEKKSEVPGTQGVQITMIPANHCPGSSLFLFEKASGKGKTPKMQRILHCGDFRACRAHVEHPLLRPDVLDAVGGKAGQQKLDVCYLDTTYLNPKYAFPPQEDVIKACADMCVSMSKEHTDDTDGWEQMKRERAGEGMAKFVRKGSDIKLEDSEDTNQNTRSRGRLLVIVGTYSIGKERICVGIARALKSKIYAPAGKQRICKALEDPELNALLTKDPHEAQVHMTPLFEIRAETLEDYLGGYREHFSRAVGFRPSGWNYRPPNSRFVESPSVQTVLHSKNWKSTYSMKELVPQRGSTKRASCFGVPYSEHSSFRELTAFCCALRIDKIIPTVNIGNAKTREKMKGWCERWAVEKKKNGLYKIEGGDGSL